MPVECNPNKRARTIYPDKNNEEKLSDKEYMSGIREDFNQALALGYKSLKTRLTHGLYQKIFKNTCIRNKKNSNI